MDPQDEALLQTVLELAEIRILAQEHPDSAQVQLELFLAKTDTVGLSEEVAQLWQDPLRGRYFLQALHDSLQAPIRETTSSARRPAGDNDGI
jgi:hypothetical protein